MIHTPHSMKLSRVPQTRSTPNTDACCAGCDLWHQIGSAKSCCPSACAELCVPHVRCASYCCRWNDVCVWVCGGGGGGGGDVNYAVLMYKVGPARALFTSIVSRTLCISRVSRASSLRSWCRWDAVGAACLCCAVECCCQNFCVFTCYYKTCYAHKISQVSQGKMSISGSHCQNPTMHGSWSDYVLYSLLLKQQVASCLQCPICESALQACAGWRSSSA